MRAKPAMHTLTVIALTCSAAPVLAQGAKFSATLTGAAEVPGPGDPDGKGSASITINPGKPELCYKLSVKDIATATGAHVHTGSPTQAGPVSVTLTAPASGSSSGCVTINRELADAIRKSPQAFYVNVHNSEFPGGAIRGQLGK
ncbi:CHRD domain-containing protein [Sphingomonas sp. HDW15A]|uniref:CHRD domain-containing protein n=1 Tax=Sphingomonas sp. HDW15A TaxID=2714942 RepID=UPI00140938C8|nr:CHRD domain-containing protein [Sphingomonas sp. HDW15A]QIK95651.1 CHRD domain-containing protein [Sphingomonas sp. HDW15A]